jgi:hypothetical protein
MHASPARSDDRCFADSGPGGGEGFPALAGEEAELAEEVHLVEEQMLGLQRVAVGRVNRRPPELNGSSRRLDIAVGGVEHTSTGARDGPFGRCGRPLGEELLDLEAESGNASWNTARKSMTLSRPLTWAPGAVISASAAHGSASPSRSLTASMC